MDVSLLENLHERTLILLLVGSTIAAAPELGRFPARSGADDSVTMDHGQLTRRLRLWCIDLHV
ncbi:hypothetical protein N7539_004950 [Penicillium diatomitis]|uniref:Uncharacterized protein n=1 Tax=Penicillium diatomitis TaxID=2819901 RepID=A0A9W9X633_9EURO|nr:uncharacterized protein N7539_004950 [Penicillium diatomitis]KAJ5484962.1 hypothetical protein N7539_004950 [Penicillium diatomitis]